MHTPLVLHCDNHLLVIAKPANFLSQADHTGDPDVVNWGKAYIKQRFDKPGKVYLGLVHRLDRLVSGVMVLARTSKAAARLSAQFRDDHPKKAYLALVSGQLKGKGTCVDYLFKQPETKRVVVVGPKHPKGQRAELDWQAWRQWSRVSALDVRLKTGRPHQIRVQLAQKGSPLLGDRRYGSDQSFSEDGIGLHCYALEVMHPTRKEPISFTCEPCDPAWHKWMGPDDWQVLFEPWQNRGSAHAALDHRD